MSTIVSTIGKTALLSNCEAELEEVSCHEREQHQTRRQLQISSPEQPILLSICEADMEQVGGHEREQHEARRQLLILGQLRDDNTSARQRLAATVLMFSAQELEIESPVQHHNTYFSTLLAWRLSPVHHIWA